MIQDRHLTTYWIEPPVGMIRQFGVSAYSLEDAVFLLREAGYEIDVNVPGTTVREGITVADLDQHHVAPNMGPMVFRGVWFPCLNL